jgi:hypothetical protein
MDVGVVVRVKKIKTSLVHKVKTFLCAKLSGSELKTLLNA